MPSFTLINDSANLNQTHLPSDPRNHSQPFSIHTSPKTDIWRIPPTTDDLNAPAYVANVKNFQKARVTVKVGDSRKYDQGGLLLLLPDSGAHTPRWIKAGVELAKKDDTNVSVVATDRFSDWSLIPVGSNQATIEMERVGVALWVYIIQEDGKRLPIREVNWAFEKEENANLRVGVYAARPTPAAQGEEDSNLAVEFTGLSITGEFQEN